MRPFFCFVLLSLSLFLFGGCVKDVCQQRYTIYTPEFKTLAEIRSARAILPAQTIRSTGKIFTWGKYILLNEPAQGIHIIDNSDPRSPRPLKFLRIPGNKDIAMRGSYLYADAYSDMLVYDLSNPASPGLVRSIAGSFPDVFPMGNIAMPNTYGRDTTRVFVGYNQRDTLVDCSDLRPTLRNCPNCMMMDASAAANKSMGKAGSMARFAVVQNHLYTVSNSSLSTFSLSDASSPLKLQARSLGWNIETIYPFKDKLFIGSATSMYSFDLNNPAAPLLRGAITHVRGCDPVVANDNYAYVTISTGNACAGDVDALFVVDVTDINRMQLRHTRTMTNPKGLALDGSTLLVCDGIDGLKILDVSNPLAPAELSSTTGMETYDVIAENGRALVVATDGLRQYDYSNPRRPALLSLLPIRK